MNVVYVIINEWTDLSGNTSSEVTDNKFFFSEGKAWEALDLIAEAYDIDLHYDDTSVQLDEDEHFHYQEYRIEALTEG